MQYSGPGIPISQTPISTLLGHDPADSLGSASLSRIELQRGVDLILWEGELADPLTLDLHDDWGRLNFSYALAGHSQFTMADQRRNNVHQLDQGMSCISYTPDCRGQTMYQGHLESLFVSVDPAVLNEMVPDLPAMLRRQLEDGRYYVQNQALAELRATAQAMSRSLHRARMSGQSLISGQSRLWLLGQSLVLASLAIESCGEPSATDDLSAEDMRRLHRARDLLLSDLTQAPTIAQLASETSLPIMKIKRGFRRLFGESVYGLFQHERMLEARKRLEAEKPVMLVASELGYTNASHFAAAFRKQFGISPSSLKRRE